jgi:hypothetical protein
MKRVFPQVEYPICAILKRHQINPKIQISEFLRHNNEDPEPSLDVDLFSFKMKTQTRSADASTINVTEREVLQLNLWDTKPSVMKAAIVPTGILSP